MDWAFWQPQIVGFGGLLGTLVTAVATFFLWRVTRTLARETTRMAEASNQPHVVATLNSNRWSTRHFDLSVDNTGNAPAYDIKVSFSPPLPNGEARDADRTIPFQNVSVLKPGQGLSSYVADYKSLENKSFFVEISWLKSSAAPERQTNSYTLNFADFEGIVRIGEDPVVKMSRHLEKLEKDLALLAEGRRHLQIDVHSTTASQDEH
ncbi:hypothetical protein HFV04_014455 [Pseudomonas sp. BIGb0427]|uniref:hypothetical protein n=1 Tax=unclassified Pseudomonas TaxID=196821 RepID=UPI0018A72FDF|nr:MULTISPECIES: hypothetical protein [unclassified Pseudomonas]QPG60751.1 hypothetical protein HFV04_014455 [Pseudomonas sp. BIGb0427]UVM68364.1 hypothetical protein LOY34_07505 [Pseudomonas sp. B21-009]